MVHLQFVFETKFAMFMNLCAAHFMQEVEVHYMLMTPRRLLILGVRKFRSFVE